MNIQVFAIHYHWRFTLLLVLLPNAAFADLACREPLSYVLHTAQHPQLQQTDISDYVQDIQNFYQRIRYRLAWFENKQPTVQGLALIDFLASAETRGLNAGDYQSVYWQNGWQHPSLAGKALSRCKLTLFDVALTITGMRYVADLHRGKIDPRQLSAQLDTHDKAFDPSAFLLELKSSGSPEHLLRGVEPSFPQYRALLRALETYRDLAKDPALNRPLQGISKSIRPGDSYLGLDELAYRLMRLGDMPAASGAYLAGYRYEGELVEAVRRFQRRHGLGDDGIIGKETFSQLEVPLTERVRQIHLALERWRWLPENLGHRPLVINIPEFRLYAFEADPAGGYRAAMNMDVIVGKSFPRYQTPVFRGDMSYIVFSPYWNVPRDILRRELQHKIKQDPAYLSEHGYQIVRDFHANAVPLPDTAGNIDKLLTGELKLRQKNGRKNALGVAKFMFPNSHAVYLHGTPAKSLFRKDQRDFSHGCIRLSEPARLAEHVLRQEKGWSRSRIDRIISGGKRHQVNLSKELEVYVLYTTVVAQDDGKVRFLKDIYGLDEKLGSVLAAADSSAETDPVN